MVQQKTREYLSNKKFLYNCIQTLQELKSDPLDINHIEFWGQEPTLNLELYTKHIEEWCNNFPNVTSYMFSTNGKAYPEKIISFLINLDKYTKQNSTITIQFSYDGNYSNNNLRKVESTLITENIKYIISQLNSINFKNLFINFQFNGVITRELIYELNSIEKIKSFIDHGESWLMQFKNLNKNNNIHISTGIPFSPEVPFLCTVDDGIALNNFYLLLKQSDPKHVKDFIGGFLRGLNSRIEALNDYGYEQISILDSLKFLSNLNFKSDEQKEIYDILSTTYYCGSNYRNIKIMYDGTLLECHNSIFETDLQYISNSSPEEYIMKKNFVNKKRIVNPIKENNPNLTDTILYRSEQIQQYSFFSIFNQAINLLYTMSLCGQAEKDYIYNKEKLLLHAYILTRFDPCSHDRRICTGSAYFINTGMIRFFCNGFLSSAVDEEGRIKEFMDE